MRKTRIIATLGPATDSPDQLGALLDAGVNIFRLNMTHAKHEWVRRVVVDIRRLARQRSLTAGILLDNQGPSIRTGDVAAPIPLMPGERFFFTIRGGTVPTGSKGTSVNYDDLGQDVKAGDTLVVDNGEMKMRIIESTPLHVECEILTEGSLGSRRHINLPGVRVSLPALTEKDRADVALALELKLDYVALSFVRDPEDIATLRACFTGQSHIPQVVAKIEHQFAVDHFDAIAEASDVVMVARGDLGVECPYEELPIIQRRIVKSCIRMGRPVIVATQMLESMITNPLPTRAEITDVANAVFEQADAIMLSAETTVGRHPIACIEVMDRIARRIERSGGANYHEEAELTQPRQKLVKSAVLLADELEARAILAFTRSGQLARFAAALRPRHSAIFAFCDNDVLAGQLTLLRGVTPVVQPACSDDPEGSIDGAVQRLLSRGFVNPGDTVVILVPGATSHDRQVDSVKMHIVP
jgi:pyruvate kinase